MGLYIVVAYVDASDPERRAMLGEDPIQETAYDTVGDLYRGLTGRGRPWDDSLGRCTGYVWHDVPGGPCNVYGCGEPRDYHLHRPAAECEPCHAPGDHHRYAGEPERIGWVFLARVPYDDARVTYGRKVPRSATYLREAWVTVHTAPDTVVRTSHYASIGR